MKSRRKMSLSLICGLLGCLCMGAGDWLMLYGDPAYDGTLRWLTRGAAAIPAWRNGLAMALSFPAVIYRIIERISLLRDLSNKLAILERG